MVNVRTEIKVSCPIEKVRNYVSNPDNAPEWYVNIKSIDWKTEKPLAIGSLLAFKAQFLGKELAYIYQVMELSSYKMVMQTADGPFPMQTSYEWEDLGSGNTRMVLRNAGKPTGFSKLFSPIMALAMRRANTKDLKLLKQILEKKRE